LLSQDTAADDANMCSCGREREVDSERCDTCNSAEFAKVELGVQHASKEKAVRRLHKQEEKEPAFVDDRDYDFTGQESDGDEDTAAVDSSTPAAAAAVAPVEPVLAASSSAAKRGAKRKVDNKHNDALAAPSSKASKTKAESTAATTSRRSSAATTTSASTRIRSLRKRLTNSSSL